MEEPPKDHRSLNPTRAVVEVALLVFLAYSVQLMREFVTAGEPGKSIGFALHDILTFPSFLIAIITGVIGCAVIEYLRNTAP